MNSIGMRERVLVAAYPLVCLFLGTVSGLASWSRDALMSALIVLILATAFLAATRQPHWPIVGGWSERALGLLFVVLVLGTLRSPCADRSWRMLILFASAAALFYLILAVDAGVLRWLLPLTATAVAAWGLIAYGLGWTSSVAVPLGHHNYMAGFLLLHLPFAASAARAARLWYVALVVQVAAIVFTGSLAALVVLAGLAIYGAPVSRRLRLFAIVPLFALTIFLPGPGVLGGLRDRIAYLVAERRDPSLSLENRLRFLRASASMMALSPVAGSGLGSVPLIASLYLRQEPGISAQGEALPQLHNLPANLLAETGLAGLALALLLLLSGPRGTGAAATGLWAYLIFALSDYQLDLPAILFPFAIVAALAIRESVPAEEPRAVTRWIALTSLFVATVAGAVLYGASAMGHYEYERLDFASATAWDSRCGFYQFELGARDAQAGREQDARNDFVQAAKQMPNIVPAATQAGASLAAAGLFDSSLPWLERGAALNYYFTLAHFHLGRARLQSGDRAGAIDSFATSLLVQPTTVWAEAWRSTPESSVYEESLERAIDRLYELAAFYPQSGPVRRWNELGAFLIARRNLLPDGPYRIVYFEVLDRDLAVNHSLLLFRRMGSPVQIAPVALLCPSPQLKVPAGIGSIRGVPSVRAIDLLK